MCKIFIISVALLLCLAMHTLAKRVDSENLIQSNMNWGCINNASCIKSVSDTALRQLLNKHSVNVGIFTIEPLETKQLASGRSSKMMNFLSGGNSVRIPIGPMLFSVQRSEDYENYLEVSLLKKVSGEGRKIKKHLQMYIPTFLAFNAVGWMLMAAMGVTVLTFKAFLVSKIAFVLASVMTIKKMFDSATEKMMSAHVMPEPEPYVMPYNMDYTSLGHSFSNHEISASDIYPYTAPLSQDMSSLTSHMSMGSLGAESAINSVVEINNATQGQNIAALTGGPKIKRQDNWTAIRRKPMFFNNGSKNPIYVYKKAK